MIDVITTSIVYSDAATRPVPYILNLISIDENLELNPAIADFMIPENGFKNC